jgi:hypothetical protein
MQHHSFVVRICAGAQGRWHGKVIYVGTQSARLFVHLDAMTEFISNHLNSGRFAPPDASELELNDGEFDCDPSETDGT